MRMAIRGSTRIARLAGKAGVRVRWRPFALGAIFKAQGWPADSPFNWQVAKGAYMWRDLQRICGDLKLPFRRPDPFPQPSLLAARMALVGLGEGWGENFARAVYRAEFGEGLQIGDPAVLTEILMQLRAEPPRVLAAAQSEAIKSKLREETGEAQRLGVFGAPTFVAADGELFWGSDRLEAALAWSKRLA